MRHAPLHPDSKYLFEFISQKDGRKSQAVVATPTEVIEWMDSQGDGFHPEEMYVNFICDVGAVNEVKPDESIGLSDLVMAVPLFSGKAFKLMFGNPEALARSKLRKKDLNKYDESITDDDFKPVPDEEQDDAP